MLHFASLCLQQYLQALHQSKLSPAAAAAAAVAPPKGPTKNNQQRQRFTSSKRSGSSGSSPASTRQSPSRPVPSIACNRPCRSPEALLSRPLSAQLRSFKLGAVSTDAAAAVVVQGSTWPPAAATDGASSPKPRSRCVYSYDADNWRTCHHVPKECMRTSATL